MVNPPLKQIPATEASNNFGAMIDDAARGHSTFVVTRMGKARAIVIGIEQYMALLEQLEIVEEQNDPEFQRLLAEARDDVELGRTLTLEEFDERFGFTLAELNDERTDEQ